MISENSLPHSQAPATCPCHEADKSNGSPSQFFQNHFNITVPSTSRFYKFFFPSGLLTNTLYVPLLSRYMGTAKAKSDTLFIYLFIYGLFNDVATCSTVKRLIILLVKSN